MKTHALLCSIAITSTGCDTGLSVIPTPLVSVLKQDGDCFARMAGEPVDPTIDVSGQCEYATDARLLASIDLVEVVVDYGPDVPFAATTSAPPPTVAVRLDGSDLGPELVSMSGELRAGDRAYFIGTFRAPATPSADLRISAAVNAGFQTIVPEVIENVAARVALVLRDCPSGTTCAFPGAVGSAHVSLAVPGRTSQLITIHSKLDDVPQPDPVPPVRTFQVDGLSEAVTAIPVPAAAPGTRWTISAQLGEAPASEVTAVIDSPTLAAQLTCGSSCALAPGDPVGLEILAPAQIRPLEALVTSRLDGVPQLVSARVPLEARADGFAVGLLGLVAPARAGTWQLDVTIAGYPAPSVMTQVQ